jgi:predicted MPP superfamily phosphohydrolase
VITRRQFLKRAAVATLGTGAVCGGWAWRVEPYWVETVRRPMPLAGLPADLIGRTLLQVSDLHVGPRVDPEFLIGALRDAAALGPDIVAVSGDLVTYRSRAELDTLGRVLAHLPRGRLATVVSLGNHDYGAEWGELDVAGGVAEVAAGAGATVLRNAARDLGGLQLAGLGDLWSPEFAPAAATLAALDPRRPAIVLSHNPDSLDLPIWGGLTGWVLAGHTHGGQCRPPFLPPPILPVRNRRYTAGPFDVAPGRTLYVNRGLGYMIPVRFNVRPEVTLFTLERV